MIICPRGSSPLLPLSYFHLVTQHSPSKAPPCSLTLKRNQYAFMSFGRSGTSAAVFPLQFSLTVSLHVLRQRRKTRGNEACVLDQLTALSKLLKAQRLLPYLSLNTHYTLWPPVMALYKLLKLLSHLLHHPNSSKHKGYFLTSSYSIIQTPQSIKSTSWLPPTALPKLPKA